ncbi:MAG: FecR domain-containing protein [Hyphomonas sp.]
MSADESQNLSDWLDAEARNHGALARAQAMLVPFESPTHIVMEEDSRRRPAQVMVLSAAVTALAACAFAAFLVYPNLSPPVPAYQTAYGEVRRVPLNDGSIMTLNTLSSVDLDFGETQRSVNLRSGEGYFQVAPDSDRPFVVTSDGYDIRAVGTAFIVRNVSEQALRVLVYEGIVRVGGNGTNPVQVRAGEQAQIRLSDHNIGVSPLDEEQLLQGLAWRDGKIALTGQTLEYAANEFNRYNQIAIVTEPGVSNLEIVGWYSANDPVGFAEVVATTFDISVDIQKNRVTLAPRLPD